MKTKAVLLCLCFLVVGCATAQPTLENLMESSYSVGCTEARLNEASSQPAKLSPQNDAQIRGIIKLCEERAKQFNPNQTGIYDPSMRLYYAKPIQREVR